MRLYTKRLINFIVWMMGLVFGLLSFRLLIDALDSLLLIIEALREEKKEDVQQ